MLTDSESGAEASDLEDEFSESEEEEEEASAQEDEPQAATNGGGSPTWGLPQGRNIKIHLFVGPGRWTEKSRITYRIKHKLHHGKEGSRNKLAI